MISQTTLAGDHQLKARYGTASLSRFSKLVSLSLINVSGGIEVASRYDIKIVLETEAKDRVRIRLTFEGVNEVKFDCIGARLMQVTGLQVVDISDRQIEGAKLKVSDYENGVVSFTCEAAKIDGLEQVEVAEV